MYIYTFILFYFIFFAFPPSNIDNDLPNTIFLFLSIVNHRNYRNITERHHHSNTRAALLSAIAWDPRERGVAETRAAGSRLAGARPDTGSSAPAVVRVPSGVFREGDTLSLPPPPPPPSHVRKGDPELAAGIARARAVRFLLPANRRLSGTQPNFG